MSDRKSLSVVPPSPVAEIKRREAEIQSLVRAELAEVLTAIEAALDRAEALTGIGVMHAGTRDALERMASATRLQMQNVRQLAERNP